MIDIFDSIAKNDQSLYYLGQIFGVVGNVLPPSMFVGNPPLILGNLFKVLNSIALTVGVIIITYTTIMGLFYTAQDGEFLGKKWNKIWVPLRTVIGIAGLFPSAGGYCALQVFLMWIVLQGISAADLLWTTALKTIQVYGNPVSGGSPAYSNEETRVQMKKVFQGMVCQHTAYRPDSDIKLIQNPKLSINYFCGNNPSHKFCVGANSSVPSGAHSLFDVNDPTHADIQTNYRRYKFGPDGACGYLEYANAQTECAKDSKSLLCKTATAQEIMMEVLFTNKPGTASLNVIAKELADKDADFVKFYERDPEINDDPESPDFKSTPMWIQNYCTTSSTAKVPGLGIPLADCCVYKSAEKDGCLANQLSFKSNTDVYKYDAAGISSSNDATVANIYLPFGLAELGSNIDFIDRTVDQYIKTVISDPTQEYLNETTPTGWFEEANNSGWLMAGSYYIKIAKLQAKDISAAPNFVSTTSDTDALEPMVNAQRNMLRSTATLLTNIEGINQVTNSAATIAPQLAGSSGNINTGINMFKQALDGFQKNLSQGKGDPIISASAEGQRLMQKMVNTFIALSVTIGAVSFVSNLMIMVFGSGPTSNPAGSMVSSLLGFMTPFIILLLVTIFSVGALLGVYVPLIPYIVFTITALGWFIGVIELMVAAPFIALGIMSPGGQSEILSHAERSLMIVFNLFLRPSLMIIGMLAAMLLANVAVTFVNSAFSSVESEIVSGQTSIFVHLMFVCAYTVLIVTVLNKCFTLIHMLPERALTYIGGQHQSYGEEQALQQVKGGVEGAASQMGQTARTGALAGWSMTSKKEDESDGSKPKTEK